MEAKLHQFEEHKRTLRLVVHEILYIGFIALLFLIIINNNSLVGDKIYSLYVLSLVVLFIERMYDSLKRIIYGPRYEEECEGSSSLIQQALVVILNVITITASLIIIFGIISTILKILL